MQEVIDAPAATQVLSQQQAMPLATQQARPLQAAAPADTTPTGLLSIAVQRGATIAELRELMLLEREFRLDQAKQAFYDAMAAFKLNPPKVYKDKHVYFVSPKGETSYDHASLATENEAIVAALAKVGITHRWDPDQSVDGKVTITCVLSLKGYEQRTALTAGYDSSGGKNTIQSIGSAVRYLERYTLEAATGIVPHDLPDDDGHGANDLPPAVSSLADEWIGKAKGAKNADQLQEVWTTGLAACKAAKDRDAADALKDAVLQRKAELGG